MEKISNTDIDIVVFWNTNAEYRTNFKNTRKSDADFKYWHWPKTSLHSSTALIEVCFSSNTADNCFLSLSIFIAHVIHIVTTWTGHLWVVHLVGSFDTRPPPHFNRHFRGERFPSVLFIHLSWKEPLEWMAQGFFTGWMPFVSPDQLSQNTKGI